MNLPINDIYMKGGPDVRNQSELMFHMRALFNVHELTTFEFITFKKILAKEASVNPNYQFDYGGEYYWQTEEQYHKR